MRKTLPTLIRFSAAIVPALALILVAPVLAETPDEKRKKKSRAGSFPSSARETAAGSRIIRPAVQPKPTQTRTPPANNKMKQAGDSVRSRPPRPGKTPSSGSDEGYSRNQQARTAGGQSAGKRQISSPSVKQGLSVKGTAATSPSATVAAKRSSPRTYPYDIKTKWGTVTIRDPSQEPKRNPKGEPMIEPPDGNRGTSWITDKDMVARGRFTKEQIQSLKDHYGDDIGTRAEELNKLNGVKGVIDNLDMRSDLEHLQVDSTKAAKVADAVSKKGTGVAKDEAFVDALIDQGMIPAGLKNTGRSPHYLLDLAGAYKDLGGDDPSEMPPEFVDDVENARRKGNADAVKEKWNDRLSVRPRPSPPGGVPGMTTTTQPPRPGLIGGSSPTGGGLPATGSTPFGPGGTAGGSSSGSTPGSAGGSTGSRGLRPGGSWSEQQASQAEQRLSSIPSSGSGSVPSGGTSPSGAAGGGSSPAPTAGTSPGSSDIDFEIEYDKAKVTSGSSPSPAETPDADASPSASPEKGDTESQPEPDADPQGTFQGWNQGFHPGIAGDMSNLGPKKGGEKINPGEQGTTGTTGGKQSSGAPRGKGQVTDPPKPLDPKSAGGPPAERPRGPKPETVYPAPDAPDQAGTIPGDTGKLTDKLGQEDDGTAPKEPTGSSGGTATATPARLRPGEKIERGGKKQGSPTPTASPTYAPGGQYTVGQPNLTPPPSPSPTPPPDN